MKEAVVKENDEKNTAKHLAESSPTQDPIDTDHLETAEESQVELSEESIIGSIRLLLREYGIRKKRRCNKRCCRYSQPKNWTKRSSQRAIKFWLQSKFRID